MTPLASGLIPFPCQYGHMGVVSRAHGGGVEIPILSHEFRRRVWGPGWPPRALRTIFSPYGGR